ncbi:hypothetical protein BHE74_00037083 [Ensete ventricosum]|nr:hypothetical protein BHE74_00037083 [Ensete ventricosum]RZS12881.1 hypothetical protein BHM03_00044389 [Ensete ventricosum]
MRRLAFQQKNEAALHSPAGIQGVASSSSLGRGAASFFYWKARRGRGDTLFTRWKTRRRLVFLRWDEALPDSSAGRRGGDEATPRFPIGRRGVASFFC